VLWGDGWFALCFLSLGALDWAVDCCYHPRDGLLSYSALLSEKDFGGERRDILNYVDRRGWLDSNKPIVLKNIAFKDNNGFIIVEAAWEVGLVSSP
jgi:hypothetical protein